MLRLEAVWDDDPMPVVSPKRTNWFCLRVQTEIKMQISKEYTPTTYLLTFQLRRGRVT